MIHASHRLLLVLISLWTVEVQMWVLCIDCEVVLPHVDVILRGAWQHADSLYVIFDLWSFAGIGVAALVICVSILYIGRCLSALG